jgi:hypothetical protein
MALQQSKKPSVCNRRCMESSLAEEFAPLQPRAIGRAAIEPRQAAPPQTSRFQSVANRARRNARALWQQAASSTIGIAAGKL